MSAKLNIKWRAQTEDQPGFHLYDDVIDAPFGDTDAPVYLRLDGLAVKLETLAEGGASVTVVLPRDIARELGLISGPTEA